MSFIFYTTCLLIMTAVGLLFHRLYKDWNGARTTAAYLESTTPMDRLKYNSVFIFMSACLVLIFIVFGYMLFCKITITPPFS